MKNTMVKAAMMAVMFFGITCNANAQFGNLLNKVSEAANKVASKATETASKASETVSKVQSTTSGNTVSNLLSTVTGVLSDKLIPSETQVQGTWTYQSPAIVFESQNTLANLGGAAVSKTVETKLQNLLAKYGVKKGKMSITFNDDNTFTVNYNTRKVSGTYSIDGKQVLLTFNGMQQPCKLTPQLNNGQLVVVGNATKIKDFLVGIGSQVQSSEINTIANLLKQVDGMLIGIRLQK